jgi:tRNA G18 (ribose-2'-O)-methylase SpoU
MHNVGSIFRTSDAFRISKIYLCGITACPPQPEIQKTALGATETVKWEYYNQTSDVLKKIKEEGFTIVLIEQTNESVDLQNFDFKDEKYALVFGNEVKGVSEDCLNLADYAIEIPQFGTKHSFNVSVCAGIVLYNFFKALTR